VAETFLLVDNDDDNNKSNNDNNKYDWFKNWSIEESPRGSWRHLPTTKEQEEKWHNSLVKGLKKEKEEKEEKSKYQKSQEKMNNL
jgi:hypothetical protein